MILPDVNVLIYAFRPDSPQHQRYRAWLREEIDSGRPFGMSPQVLSSVVRIVTNPRIYAKPDSVDEALRFGEVLLTHPNCQVVRPGPRHWGVFADLCRGTAVSGGLVADAWLAALAIESGCEWITTDGDFARFPDLLWRAPF